MEKFLRSNYLARALAVFLAIALWLFVTGDNITRNTPSRTVMKDVPLNYENLEPGLVVTSELGTVDVTLEGLADAFEGLTISDVDAHVDLAEKEAGVHRLQVRVKPPRGLELVTFTPEQVELVIEPLISADFPVYVEYSGTPAAGWMRQKAGFEPMHISVEGPQSMIETISRVVLYIDQSGKRSEFKGELAPVLLDDQGKEIDSKGLEISPEKIAFTIYFVEVGD